MPVNDADTDVTTLGFETASLREYVAYAWCVDLSGNLYASEAVNVQAVDNGGTVTALTFTFEEAGVNDVDN